MNEREQEVVAQTMIPLPFLSDEVPALYLADGRPYIPVFVVCQALGVCPDIHIQRWRRLLLGVTARKLLQDQGELPVIDAVRIGAETAWATPLERAFGGIDDHKALTSIHRLSHYHSRYPTTTTARHD